MHSINIRHGLLAFSCLLAVLGSTASAAPVTISDANAFVEAPGDSNSNNSAAIPTNVSLSASSRVGFTSSSLAYTSSGDLTKFRNSTDFGRSSGFNSSGPLVNGAQGRVNFTVAEDSTYSMFGALNITDPSSTQPVASKGELVGELMDVTGGSSTYLFRSSQSAVVEDLSFLIGESGDFSGSLTGLLLAGHSYSFFYYSRMTGAESGTPDLGANAFSRLELSITTSATAPESVPEPGTLALLLVGALGLRATRQRQRV